MSAKKLLIGNWKMNLGPAAGRELLLTLKERVARCAGTDVWVAPPALTVNAVTEAAQASPIKVGAQNVHWEAQGAFTGELSAPMLRECGCTFALVGHSERRMHFSESEEQCARRALGAMAAGITVVFCVGERLEDREQGKTLAVIERQLRPLLADPGKVPASMCILAYEPVWAIGTGKVCAPADIQETCNGIRELWQKLAGSAAPLILYGGSVDPGNFAEIVRIPGVGGGLVGGASLKSDKFLALIDIAEKETGA